MIMVDYDRTNSTTNSRPSSAHYSATPHVGSPHLQNFDRPSAHSTPSPTLHYAPLPHLNQQPISRPPPPTSYPSPSPYSPNMTAYPYPPQSVSQQHQQPQRLGSPLYPNTQPPISLPPIRMNPIATQLPPLPSSHEGSPMPGSPIPQQPMPGAPPPMYAGALPGYYPPPIPQATHHLIQSPSHNPPRYRFTAGQEKIMSGGRHKKEIKRRTKTGCLTCRKRRIKVCSTRERWLLAGGFAFCLNFDLNSSSTVRRRSSYL